MRKLIYPINLSVDGRFDHTPSNPDDELLDYCARLVREADLLVYGRKTYEMMVPYWPDIAKNPAGETKADVEFAQAFDSIDKIVFSRTLDRAEGRNTRIIRSNLQDEILKLKNEQGKNILVGGVDLPSQLIDLGLVDEFLFIVHPVIAGEGRRLMEGTDMRENVQLKLVGPKVFQSGTILLHYLKK